MLTELALTLGNRCGHRPHAPRLLPESLKARGHHLLRRAGERFNRIYGVRHTRAFRTDWPELFAREKAGDGDEATDYEYRRSERLEAVCLVLGVLLKHLDIASSKVVVDANVDRGVDVERISDEAKISVRRTERALRSLRKAGIISFTEQRRKRLLVCSRCENELRECSCTDPPVACELWVSDAAIRKLTPRFFFKLGPDLAKEYQRVRKQLDSKPRVPPPGRPLDLRVPPARKRASIFQSQPPPPPVQSDEHNRSVHQLITELMSKGMSAAQAFEAVRNMRRQQ